VTQVAEAWPLDQGDDAELLLAMAQAFPLDPARHVGVAVSGGGDSVALLHLMARACRHWGVPVSAVTVDHCLRPASADEAAMVARLCDMLGVPHQTVTWDHGPISGNLMDKARRARMALIADWARRKVITQVALGHTADDQAETFLMALSRSAGLDGLVAMPRNWRDHGLCWARPLLDARRADLRTYLQRHGIAWAEDPTNDDPRHERVRVRRVLGLLEPLGIDADKIGRSLSHLQWAKRALDTVLRKAFETHVIEVAGALRIDRAGFDDLPHELQRQMLLAGIAWLSGNRLPPRHDKQLNLLYAARDLRVVTLQGCRLRHQPGHLLLAREPRAANGTGPVGTLWDHRWLVEGPPGDVRALGPKGLPQVKSWRTLGIPRDALLVTPAVWDGDTLLAAPVAGMENGWKARIVAPFHRFTVSH